MRFYRALLRFYPKSFRAEYGAQILSVIADRQAAAPHIASRVGLALETAADTLVTAVRVHADILAQDLRYAVRTLLRAPVFALTAVVVSALGIGATTAALAVADHVLLRPLPYAEPDRLVRFWQADKTAGGYNVLSPGNYRDLIARASGFESVAAYTPQFANLVGIGAPVRLEGQFATGDLFAVLGRRPVLGRAFTPADERGSTQPVVVLAYRTWVTHFGSDEGTIGTAIRLNGTPHTVIGVMPQDFMFPDRYTEFWAPLTLDPRAFEDRSNTFLWTVARLRDGQSLEQADAELDAAAAELERRFPKENARLSILTVGLRGNLTRADRTMMAAVAGASCCLLLIAGINLAGLLLARGLSRQRELAVRGAIGAGRERLIRQLLTESCAVAAAGGGLGALMAALSTPVLARLIPTSLPITETPSVDWRFASVASLAVLIATAVFGVLPARRATAWASPDALREGPRTGSGRRTESLRSTLVAVQVAISVVLLISVGLLGQALWRVRTTDPGFDARGVLTMRTALPWPKYGPTANRVAFYDRVLGDIRALPGVEHAAYITGLPMVVPGLIWEVEAEGGAPVLPRRNTVGLRFVTSGYFDAMKIRFLEGRDVSRADTSEAPFVAVVSESFARRHWPGRSAVGRRIKVAFYDRRVVGVVSDVRVRGLERESEPQVYLAAAQVPDFGLLNSPPRDLVVRAHAPVPTILPAIRRIIGRADPEQPISNVRLLEDILADQTAPRSAQLGVLAGFAGVALLLASVGIYGLLAFAVSQRMREIGLRMALGATPLSMIGMVVKRGVSLAGVGTAFGLAAAYATGRSLQALLAGISPSDPATYLCAVAVILALALLGTLLPALRASRINPLEATRE
jgi:putative ABC transport system permease protein